MPPSSGSRRKAAAAIPSQLDKLGDEPTDKQLAKLFEHQAAHFHDSPVADALVDRPKLAMRCTAAARYSSGFAAAMRLMVRIGPAAVKPSEALGGPTAPVPAHNRSRDVLELVAWFVVAPLLPIAGMHVLLGTLAGAYGSLELVPVQIVAVLPYVSPVFPLLLGTAAYLRLRRRGEGLRELIGWDRASVRADVLGALLLAAATLGVALASLSLFAHWAPSLVPPLGEMPTSLHLYYATVGAVVPGVGEELFYRGLTTRLARGKSTVVLALISGVAFALWHVTAPAYLPHTFLLGVLLTVQTVRARGRLFPAMVTHTAANAAMGVVLGLGLWSP